MFKRFLKTNRRRSGLTQPHVVAAEVLESRTLLTEFVVSALGDVSDGNFAEGQQTLREAIERANNDPDADTIVFGDLPGNLIANGSPLTITEDVTITGLGARDLTIAGQGGVGLFIIAEGVTVTLTDMFITGGYSSRTGTQGGAIYNQGDLSLQGVRIGGTAGQGGGIYSEGTLLLQDSTISQSTADAGGGIYINGGTAEIVNSTLFGNTANAGELAGGGIYVGGGAVTITNSTIVSNRARSLSTTGAGGGVYMNSTGTVTVHNSIIAGNVGSSTDIAGTVEAGSSYNVIGDTDAAGGLIDGTDSNIVGNAGTGVLDVATVVETTLADNGGSTDTLALLSDSPALNSGSNDLAVGNGIALTGDQRGFPRIVGGTVDRGAIERAATEDILAFDDATGVWTLGFSDGFQFSEVTGPQWSTDVTWRTYSGDFNGDGRADGLGYQEETGQWYAALSTGETLQTDYFGRWSNLIDAGWQYVQVGDVNGDGMDDIVGMTATGQWWAGISDGTRFLSQYLGKWSATGWASIQLGDINGDGTADLIGYRPDNGQWWAGFSNGSRIQTTFIGKWNASNTWQNFLMGELTGDGAMDVMAQTTGGAWYIGTLNSNELGTIYAGSTRTEFSRGGPLLGDFNGDGLDDLLLTGTNAIMYVKLANGGGMDATVAWGSVPEFDTVESVRFIGDWNGDGRDDAAAFGNSGGFWGAMISTGTAFENQDFGRWLEVDSPDHFFSGFLDN